MAHAKVFFEDPEDGSPGAAVRFVFTDGFDPKSHAHQLANHLRVMMDQLEADGALTAITPRVDEGDMTQADAAKAALVDDKQIALIQ